MELVPDGLSAVLVLERSRCLLRGSFDTIGWPQRHLDHTFARTGKPTKWRRYAVREAGVSWFISPLKPPVHHSSIVLRGLRGSLNWARIMPRDAVSRAMDESFRRL